MRSKGKWKRKDHYRGAKVKKKRKTVQSREKTDTQHKILSPKPRTVNFLFYHETNQWKNRKRKMSVIRLNFSLQNDKHAIMSRVLRSKFLFYSSSSTFLLSHQVSSHTLTNYCTINCLVKQENPNH